MWVAICIYVLMAILRKELHLQLSLHTILQILSVNVFEKVTLAELFTDVPLERKEGNIHNQLNFNYI